MDYETSYKELIEKIKSEHEKADGITRESFERILPKLRENEDERMRKIVWDILLVDSDEIREILDANNVLIQDVYAWLEKQGEQNLTLPKWKYKNDNAPLLRDSLILNKYGCVAKSPSGAIVSGVWVIDYDELAKLPKEEIEKQSKQETLCDKCRKEQPSHSCQDITALGRCALEKQGEQKPADNIKPKFKIGDWAVSNLDKKARQISEVYFDEYNNYYVVESNEYDIEEYDRLHHLWTIQDAKNGDVLAYENDIVIFKENNYNPKDKSGCMFVYCSCNNFYEIGGINPTDYKPATKEQRDALFAKMKEAGYEWDSEKKELKKIIGEKQIKKNLQDNSFRKMFEQKLAWSKEDENNILFLTSIIEECFKDKEKITLCGDTVCANFTKEDVIERLKSIRPQNRWKPSEEQIDALRKAVTDGIILNSKEGHTLRNLLLQLAKLNNNNETMCNTDNY